MASPTAINLLSALRRAGSTSAVREIPESYFQEPDELAAFRYLRDHVQTYRAFPDPAMFRRNTGIQTVVTNQPLSYYVDEGRKKALYEALITPFENMKEALEGQDPDAFVRVCREVMQTSVGFISATADFSTLQAALELVVTDYEQAVLTGGMRGIPTGWPYLDEQTAGWFADDLISVVGRIGHGKTYIMLVMAYTAWRAGYNVLFVTMELGVLQLARRLFGLHTRLNPSLIRTGRLSTHFHNQIRELASGMVSGIPFNIIAGGFKKSVETVQAVADATNPDIIFVDAAYLLVPAKKRKGSEGRRETISDTIEDLKRLASERHRPVVQSVQFNRQANRVRNREAGDSRRRNPTAHIDLTKIAETDVIGQSSSVVLGLAKAFPPHSETRRWLKVLKGREGEAGIIQMRYEFSPVCFDQIGVNQDDDFDEDAQAPAQDMSHMI